ncbi:MAG: sigma-70 family RNA polymerase sigma factor [Planctomycetota bacterium]
MDTPSDSHNDVELATRLRTGDDEALAQLFSRHRERLRHMVRLRCDPRLTGRVDPDDILQEAWLAAHTRRGQLAEQPDLPPFLWLRLIVGQTLIDTHRRHLGTRARTAAREVPLLLAAPMVSSECLARHLSASQTSPSQAAMRGEASEELLAAINGLAPIDREVLMLRHFEELTNDEVAEVLELSRTAASNRYVRAVTRLRHAMGTEDE